MEDKRIKILLIEDDPDYPQLLEVMLFGGKGAMFDLECAQLLQTGLDRLREGGIDVVLLDLTLPDSRGLDTFAKAYAQSPEVPIIVLSCLDDEQLTIAAVRDGAQDYLVKDWMNKNVLIRSIHYAIERHRMLEELKQKTQKLQASEARNRAVLDAIPDMMFQISKEGVFLDHRAAVGDGPAMFPGKLTGKRAQDALPADLAEQVMNCALRALQEGKAQVLEYQYPQNDEVRHYEARMVTLADEEGVLAIVRDITERKELDRMKSEVFWRMRKAKLR